MTTAGDGAGPLGEERAVPDALELISLFILAVIGFWGWRYFRAGSLVGALLGGRIRETVGEIVLASSSAGSSVLRVQLLDTRDGAEPVVVLSVTQKGLLRASMIPIRLTRAQAREVGALLQRAGSSG